jgi:PAS domain S-box-containing protein
VRERTAAEVGADGALLERCVLVPAVEPPAEVELQRLRQLVASLERRNEELAASLASQRAIAQALREHEEQLRTLVDASPDIICFKDGEGRWLYANPADLDLFDLAAVDYRGKTDADLAIVQPYFAEPFNACLDSDEAAWRRGPVVTQGEEVIRRRDGIVKVYDVLKVPLFWPDGRRKGLVVLGRDVTEQKRAEKALVASRARLLTTIENLPAGVLLLDAGGRTRLANSAAERILGLPRSVLLGAPYEALGLTAGRGAGAAVPAARYQAPPGAGGALLGEEMEFLRPDGSRAILLVNAAPLREGPYATLVAFQDISPRASIDRMKSEFLSLASHELRTPLTPLALLVQRSRRRLADGAPVGDEALRRMEKQITRLTVLIDALVDVSRLERGEFALRSESVDLTGLVAGLVEELPQQAPGRRLVADLPAGPLFVVGDPARLEQLLGNLLDNALRYSPESQPVEVSVRAEGELVRVSVADRGAGIPGEQQTRLFTRFHRLAPESSPRQQGLGLGLFLAHEIAVAHGGELSYEARPGGGSTFHLTLPLRGGS